MTNIDMFITGWFNLIRQKFGNIDENLLDLSKYRILICKKCDLFSRGFCSSNKSTLNIKTNKIVNGCGCYLMAKTICEKCKCPADKW